MRSIRARGIAAVLAVLLVAGGAVAVVDLGGRAPAEKSAEVTPAPVPGETPSDPEFAPPVLREPSFSLPPREPGVAVVDGEEYASVRAALSAAEPGDTVELSGWFDETVLITTPGVTVTGAGESLAVVNGSSSGHVVVVAAPNVTLRRVWVRNSGTDATAHDAAVRIEAPDVTVRESRLTRFQYGVWVEGVDRVAVVNNTVVGHPGAGPAPARGDAVHVWQSTGSRVADNRVTDVRNGVYVAWSDRVHVEGNTLWSLGYGVHVLSSQDSTVRRNVAFGNDVGALAVSSRRLVVRDNVAVNNTGTSGHGLLLRDVDDSRLVNNTLLDNDHGLFVDNAVDNAIRENRIEGNRVGIVFDSEDNVLVGNHIGRNGVGVILVKPVDSGTLATLHRDNDFVANDRAAELSEF